MPLNFHVCWDMYVTKKNLLFSYMFANLTLGVLLGHKVTPVISHAFDLLPLSSFSSIRIFYIALIYYFLVRLSLFVSNNKRHNGWTDCTHNLCGTSHNPREGLWMLRISNNCLLKTSNTQKKIFNRTILFLLYFMQGVDAQR